MRAFACAAIMLVSMATSVPFSGTALAQAGSTGGTLGNTDKSVSGDRREEPAEPRSRPHKSASPAVADRPKSSGCGGVVGTYKWFLGTTTTINANGTATNSSGNRGNWTCASGQVTIDWVDGNIDRLTPAAGGFSVSNNFIGRFSAVHM